MQNIGNDAVLLVVDLQNDFMPGGALAVAKGDQIVESINVLARLYHERGSKVVLTQDWHPLKHKSFASAYSDKKPGDPIQTVGLGPILWPDHCVQNTFGAEFQKTVKTQFANLILRKGSNPEIDSYSAFVENDKKTQTGLTGYLKDLKILKVFVCGLALDYCCLFSALDAKTAGFEVYFVQDLTKGIDLPANNITNAIQTMQQAGIHIISQREIR
jgi:nicotinamidase/pyrazinamidase